MKKPIFFAVMASAMFSSLPAEARDITVQMLNRGADGSIMVFEPALVKAMPGDVIHFVPTNPGHNAEIIPSFLPDGEVASKGVIGKEFALKVRSAGLYGIRCTPHYSMGMVALVEVGKGTPPNAAAAESVKLPMLAAKRMQSMLALTK